MCCDCVHVCVCISDWTHARRVLHLLSQHTVQRACVCICLLWDVLLGATAVLLHVAQLQPHAQQEALDSFKLHPSPLYVCSDTSAGSMAYMGCIISAHLLQTHLPYQLCSGFAKTPWACIFVHWPCVALISLTAAESQQQQCCLIHNCKTIQLPTSRGALQPNTCM
jgi:hypothetical protein